MSVLTNNNEPLTQSDGKVYSDIPNGENDFYYHRYKDDGFNKLYLSSKYLKDAVISGANEIASINDSFNQIGTANGTVLLDRGFKQSGSISNYISVERGEPLGMDDHDLFFGCWAMWDGVTANALTLMGNSSTNSNRGFQIGYYSGSWFFLVPLTATSEIFFNIPHVLTAYKWVYVSCIRKGDILFILINGVLIGTNSSLSANQLLHENNRTSIFVGYGGRGISDYWNGLSDDLLIRVGNTPIDPTGYVVGNKVFEPPIRGGFDSIIKQYPIPV